MATPIDDERKQHDIKLGAALDLLYKEVKDDLTACRALVVVETAVVDLGKRKATEVATATAGSSVSTDGEPAPKRQKVERDPRLTAFEAAGVGNSDQLGNHADTQLNYAAGHAGLGVRLYSCGDGTAYVYEQSGEDNVPVAWLVLNGDDDLVHDYRDKDGKPIKWEKIGEAGMDTAQLLLTDPCYILPDAPLSPVPAASK